MLYYMNICIPLKFKEKITLTEADQEDLIAIIEKILPEAPQFKTLLLNQLCNAKSMDPRRCRWSREMISLCLNLWAK